MSIRILLVEDSPVALTILKRILEGATDIEVVGTAQTGLEALPLVHRMQPDVICTDFHMPEMDGLEFTTQVMTQHPCPILVVSESVQEEDTQRIFQLLEAGAVDILPKPRAGLDPDSTLLKQSLINKVKVLSGVRVFKKSRSPAFAASLEHRSADADTSDVLVPCRPKMLTVGASTGGPMALQKFLAYLPADFTLPIVCIQHISLGFLPGLIDWLATQCKLSVQVAQAGTRPEPGNVYFPPEQRHLEIDAHGRFQYVNGHSTENHCPSITTTFNSIARFYGPRAIGILLTGMGRDGAEGLQAICQMGGLTIAQDEASSVVFGMPQAAIALNAARRVLPIQDIAPFVLTQLQF